MQPKTPKLLEDIRDAAVFIMKVNYDAKTDTLTVIFREVPVAESDEEKPGVILDYDEAGNIVSIEVLDASRRVEEPRTVTLHTEE
jgi:YD repeat-containing protein